MIDYTDKSIKFKVADFVLSFPTNTHFETFNNPDNYYGVIFITDRFRFEVLECKLGTRLLINGTLGEARDMPFSMRTAHFLPDYIEVVNLQNLNEKR